eukprot:3254678-Pyramimonas_sp.AAC.1
MIIVVVCLPIEAARQLHAGFIGISRFKIKHCPLERTKKHDNSSGFSYFVTDAKQQQSNSTQSIVLARVEQASVKDLASPSIVRHGKLLLVAYETNQFNKAEYAHLNSRPSLILVASEDDGLTWTRCAAFQDVFWATLFSTSSGIYLIGSQTNVPHHPPFPQNNIVITKMLDSSCKRWHPRVQLTRSLLVCSHNTGVVVTESRIFKPFELIRNDTAYTRTAKEIFCTTDMICNVSVEDAHHFVLNQRLSIEIGGSEGNPLAATLIEKKLPTRELSLLISHVPSGRHQIRIPHGTIVRGPNLKKGFRFADVNWLPTGLYAHKDKNLLDPKSWVISEPIGIPLNTYNKRKLSDFGFAHKPFFMEGVPVPASLTEKNPDVLVWYRINNVRQCNRGGLVRFHATDDIYLQPTFVGVLELPGGAVAHPAIIPDSEYGVFWMVSNMVRNSNHVWPARHQGRALGLKLTPDSSCEADRSALGLYVSKNAVDWHFVSVVVLVKDVRYHYSYSHMMIDGEDLLIVCRAHVPKLVVPGPPRFNNHNSNSVVFIRMPRFRHMIPSDLLDWVSSPLPY